MKKSLLRRTIAKRKQGSSQIWTRSKQTLNIDYERVSLSFLSVVYTLKGTSKNTFPTFLSQLFTV